MMVQYIPGESVFHRLDPRSKIVFMLLVTTLIFVVRDLWVAGAVLLTMVLFWLVARLPLSVAVGLGKALLGVMVFLFVVQAIFYPGDTALIRPLIPPGVPLVGGRGQVALEGILFALLLSLRLLAMMLVLPLVSMTTPVHVFTLGLVRLGLPYRLAYTMTTALNLIPILQTEANVIRDAQRLRAFQVFERGGFFEKLKAYPALVTPLIIGAMRRAQLIAVAMDSRAFGASAHRTYIRDIRMRAGDWAFVAFSVLYVGAAVAANYLALAGAGTAPLHVL
jgi:energy-coupling factor transport system permease protein